jgi:hypothetical protein
MYVVLRVIYPIHLSDFETTWIFSTDFSKNTQKPNFMKTCPVGGELLFADRWTDIEKQRDRRTDRQTERLTDLINIIFVCRNFYNVPKNGPCCILNMHFYGFWSNITIRQYALNVFFAILHIPLPLILTSDTQISVCIHSVSVTCVNLLDTFNRISAETYFRRWQFRASS